jgi:hypothetical protein
MHFLFEKIPHHTQLLLLHGIPEPGFFLHLLPPCREMMFNKGPGLRQAKRWLERRRGRERETQGERHTQGETHTERKGETPQRERDREKRETEMASLRGLT